MALSPADTHKLKDLHRKNESTAVAQPLPDTTPAAPEASLVHIHPPGPDLGRRYRIAREPVTIGRLESCDVCDADTLVSRIHARIELGTDGQFRLTDLGSTNGTFVNHNRVAATTLADGDYVRVGGSMYRFLAGGNIEAEYHEELHRLAVTDPLTGLPNRRALGEFLDREVERARRYARPLSLVLFDVDHFKAVNDRLGHVAGDLVLRALARAVQPLVRKDELLARYGGEEFALALPEADARAGVLCGERLRRAVEQAAVTWDGERVAVTVSVGVGTADGGATVEELLRVADERLYEAKRGGRNRVCPGLPG